jgi:hypothetical protein
MGQRELATLRPGRAVASSGRGGMSPVGWGMSAGPMRWGGGEPPIGAAGQLPAALMDRPVVLAAQRGQVGQVGGAALLPGHQVVALAPGQGPGTVREDTATVAHRQGAALGGGDDPAGPSHIQRLAGAPPGSGATGAMAAWSRAAKLPSSPDSSARCGAWCSLGWRRHKPAADRPRVPVVRPSQAHPP